MPSKCSTKGQEVDQALIKTQALIILFLNPTHIIIVGILYCHCLTLLQSYFKINQLRKKSAQASLSIPIHKIMSFNNSLPSIPLLWYTKFSFIDTEKQETIPNSYKENKKSIKIILSVILYQLYTHLQKFRVSRSGFFPLLEENQTKKG